MRWERLPAEIKTIIFELLAVLKDTSKKLDLFKSNFHHEATSAWCQKILVIKFPKSLLERTILILLRYASEPIALDVVQRLLPKGIPKIRV
ncbi:hypothetical protein EYZ11_004267 [Aspergillus tanneri]|uniref:Uncharacterized protein n=1 Tax=Aspergillus tanneri TaxID=1220188 RepID=A0A4V3UPT0_9EURO|nr:hypothetical protein EYZ11_004267 [Aspergillus tanneri]